MTTQMPNQTQSLEQSSRNSTLDFANQSFSEEKEFLCMSPGSASGTASLTGSHDPSDPFLQFEILVDSNHEAKFEKEIRGKQKELGLLIKLDRFLDHDVSTSTMLDVSSSSLQLHPTPSRPNIHRKKGLLASPMKPRFQPPMLDEQSVSEVSTSMANASPLDIDNILASSYSPRKRGLNHSRRYLSSPRKGSNQKFPAATFPTLDTSASNFEGRTSQETILPPPAEANDSFDEEEFGKMEKLLFEYLKKSELGRVVAC